MGQSWYVKQGLPGSKVLPNSHPPAKEEDCEIMRISYPRFPLPLSRSRSFLHLPFFLTCSMEIEYSWPKLGGKNCHLVKGAGHCAISFIGILFNHHKALWKKKKWSTERNRSFSKVTQLVRSRAQSHIQACLTPESSSLWKIPDTLITSLSCLLVCWKELCPARPLQLF